MLERAALRGRSRTHAYLVLLRVEVAAFHPAAPASPEATRTPRSNRGGVRPTGRTLAADSSLWPCSSASLARERAADRAAVSRYLALWSPDLPRCRKHRDRPVCLAPELYGRIGRGALTLPRPRPTADASARLRCIAQPPTHRLAANTSRPGHTRFSTPRRTRPVNLMRTIKKASVHTPLRQQRLATSVHTPLRQ